MPSHPPVAIWLAVRWCLLAQIVELESSSGISVLRRSGRLVRGRWIRTGSLVGVSAALALVTAYVYFDARARGELEPADERKELPAEIELSGSS